MLQSVYTFGVIFFFNDTATTEIYTLSLHDALPIFDTVELVMEMEEAFEITIADRDAERLQTVGDAYRYILETLEARSEEHTSELQSRQYLVCRLLLEKKNIMNPLTCYYTVIFLAIH